jgi:hypothetical protein
MLNKIWVKNVCALAVGLFISCCFGVSSSQASEKHEKKHGHDKRQLESHEHGVSTLKIALEGQTLEMELESPANDIVGFEHAPENESQKAKVENALALLKSEAGVFKTPSAANCKITDVSGEFEVEKDHAGFHVTWKIKCLNPGKIKNLETTFFQQFPKAEEIEVEIITASGQKAIEWENDTKKIKLPTLSK